MTPAAELIVHPPGRCMQCFTDNTAQLHRQTTSSGSEVFTYVCRKCGKRNPYSTTGLFVRKQAVLKRLTKQEVESLPQIVSGEALYCERCGAVGAEWHHWAPQEIFEDAHDWPQSPLCVSCHNLWHRTIEEFYVRRAIYTPRNG